MYRLTVTLQIYIYFPINQRLGNFLFTLTLH